jgi:hypothetical protein
MARTCYDHLAGQLGVAIADALVTRGVIGLDDDGGVITALGIEFFKGLGIALAAPSTRPLVRPCLVGRDALRELFAIGALRQDHADG